MLLSSEALSDEPGLWLERMMHAVGSLSRHRPLGESRKHNQASSWFSFEPLLMAQVMSSRLEE